ncbi:50S ribosomal protein L4 [Patescibacteria group bacterium]|nr:50S ribosomal protein L4 [Patescibacteria group bacterium]
MMVVKSTTKKVVKAEKAVKNTPAGLGPQKNPPQPSLKGGSNAGSPPLGGVRGDLQVSVYNQDGKEAGQIVLPKEIFGLKINSDLVAQAVRAQMANSRDSIAHSKDRSEVRGGGKKPWRQKGTGRARHASIRSPLWAGGGVTFGPRKEKNFSLNINKKMKRQALLMVLSGKVRDGEIIVLEELKLAQPKTKEMVQIVKSLKSKVKNDLDRGVMIVMPEKDETLMRAARNLPKVSTIGVGSLNIVDLLSVKYLVMPKAAIEKIRETFKK